MDTCSGHIPGGHVLDPLPHGHVFGAQPQWARVGAPPNGHVLGTSQWARVWAHPNGHMLRHLPSGHVLGHLPNGHVLGHLPSGHVLGHLPSGNGATAFAPSETKIYRSFFVEKWFVVSGQVTYISWVITTGHAQFCHLKIHARFAL